MSLPKTIQREIEVAFSKNAQPVWFRVVKYSVIGFLLYFLWGSKRLWIVFGAIFVLALPCISGTGTKPMAGQKAMGVGTTKRIGPGNE